jgi:hypothetical protein
MMEGSGSSTAAAAVGTSDTLLKEQVEVIVPKPRGKNWPHMKILCTERADVVAMILHAVHDCKCTTELNASNSDDPKGNNWNQLYDHCFGGGSEGRGLLAGHLPLLPNPTKLKIKVMDIWAHLKKESTKDPIKVDMDHVQTALRQEIEYEDRWSRHSNCGNYLISSYLTSKLASKQLAWQQLSRQIDIACICNDKAIEATREHSYNCRCSWH